MISHLAKGSSSLLPADLLRPILTCLVKVWEALQYPTTQHNITPYSSLQYSKTVNNNLQHSKPQLNTLQQSTPQLNVPQHITTHHNKSQHITTQYNPSRHIKTQRHFAPHHNTLEHITKHLTASNSLHHPGHDGEELPGEGRDRDCPGGCPAAQEGTDWTAAGK